MAHTTDAGRPPTPHYCAHPVDALAAAGCPRWPACATLADPDEEPDEDETPGLAVSLAFLLGLVVAIALIVACVVVLLPLFVIR